MRLPDYWTIPVLWPGERVVCIGSGPSLTPEDVAFCRGRARVIAINNAFRRAPWADVLYACGVYHAGKSWWEYYPDARQFAGLKVTMDPDMAVYPELKVVKRGEQTGLSMDRQTLSHGANSGYAAINLAVLLGATEIVLLGYDMQLGPQQQIHWHPDHPRQLYPPFVDFLLAFGTLPPLLAPLGVSVVNCTRSTALTVFPQWSLEDALCRSQLPTS